MFHEFSSHWPDLVQSCNLLWLGYVTPCSSRHVGRCFVVVIFFLFALGVVFTRVFLSSVCYYYFLLCVWCVLLTCKRPRLGALGTVERSWKRNFLLVVFTLLVKSFPQHYKKTNKASSQHIVRSVGKARVGRKRLLPAHEAILAQRLVPNLRRLCGAVKKKKLNVTGLVAWSGGNVTCGGNSKHFSSTFVGGERRRVCCSFYSWLMVRENEKRPWHLFLLSFCVCVFLFSWDRSRCSFFIFCCSNLFFFFVYASATVKHASISSVLSLLVQRRTAKTCWIAERAIFWKLFLQKDNAEKKKIYLEYQQKIAQKKLRGPFDPQYKNFIFQK